VEPELGFGGLNITPVKVINRYAVISLCGAMQMAMGLQTLTFSPSTIPIVAITPLSLSVSHRDLLKQKDKKL